uniref:Uncharacterized protein n=1 Tax=Panagrolaimus sp. JU765 TaxID=591449 RepID=A0AC34Q8A4_9BILA
MPTNLSEPTEIELENKPGILTLMKPGYTLDGVFDPEHEDFIFCCHIHTRIKLFSAIVGLLRLVIILYYFMNIDLSALAILYQVSGLISNTALFLGVFFWKKFYKWLKLVMWYMFFQLFYDFGSLIYVIVFVIVAMNVKADPNSTVKFEAMAYLFSSLTISADLLINLVVLYTLYVEFKYLQGRIKNGLF